MHDVITIGTATRDVFLTSPLFKVVHDPKHLERLGFPTGEAQCFALGGKIEVDQPVLTVGGGAANAAVTFARQGFKTAAFIKIGKDDNGEAVLRDLKHEHVLPMPVFDKKIMTAYSAILISPGGERTILNFRGASEDLTLREIPFSKLRAKVAYIAPGRIAFPLMSKMISAFKVGGAMIAIDLSKYYLNLGIKKLKPILINTDVIHVNREEGAYLTGVPYHDERGIFKKFDKLVRGIAVMTDGPKGVLVSDGRKIYSAGVFKEKKLVDRTGAGDAFGSGFVSALLRYEKKSGSYPEHAIVEAIRLASANATSVVEYIGAQPGILKRNEFVKSSRWRKLKINVKNL